MSSTSIPTIAGLSEKVFSNQSQSDSLIRRSRKSKPLTYFNLPTTGRLQPTSNNLLSVNNARHHHHHSRRISSHRSISTSHFNSNKFSFSRSLSVLFFTLCLFILLIPNDVEALRAHTKFYVVRKQSNLGSNGIKKMENEILRLNGGGKELKSFRFRMGLGEGSNKVQKVEKKTRVVEEKVQEPIFDFEKFDNNALILDGKGYEFDLFNFNKTQENSFLSSLSTSSSSSITIQPQPSCSIKYQGYFPSSTNLVQEQRRSKMRVQVGAGQDRWMSRMRQFVFSQSRGEL